ncbi:hypothetical protein NBCG_00665 [Nocardioidaceae bacterium Broad-1]|nr:hypothetical protein NBCG_00665 [Nocardioidaceae bacterium Broad-1]
MAVPTTGVDPRTIGRSWIIVARHRQPAGTKDPAPWGEAHLKRIGTSTTICGAPAQGWHAFWQLRSEDIRRWCTECSAAARPTRTVSGILSTK